MSSDETTEPEALSVDQRRSGINARPEIEDIARIIGGHTDLPISKRLAIARSIVGNGYAVREDQGPAAGCHLCVGAGGREDHDGVWVECSCQRPAARDREALSEFLFTVYEHGTQPNALREADAILSFLASRRPAQAPTDEEREALIGLNLASYPAVMSDGYSSAVIRTNEEAADIVIAAGFRRPVQDAAVAELRRKFGASNDTHAWIEFQGDPHFIVNTVLRAAFTAGQEDKP